MGIEQRRTIRFKTTLRGQEVDVEMGIRSMAPISFTVEFHGAVPSGGAPTRQELSALAREAARVSAADAKYVVECNGEIPGVRCEPGWEGAFTRQQAPDALFANDTRITKDNGEPADIPPLGTRGTVLGSLYHPTIGFGYFVEWDTKPRHAVFVVGWKIAKA